MDSDPGWGQPAVAEALAVLRPVRGRGGTLSPLEEEVADLVSSVLEEPGAEDDPKRELALDRGWFADLSLVVVDAILARDKRALDAVESLLQRLFRALAVRQPAVRQRHESYDAPEAARYEAWLQSASDYVRSALERLAPVAAATAIAGGHAEQFLRIVAQHPGINSRKLGAALAAARSTRAARGDTADPSPEPAGSRPDRLDEAQVSRLGAKLRGDGLVVAQRGTQGLSWEITPRGELVLERLLGAHANVETDADHPVGSMVIATANASRAGILAALTGCAPQQVAILSGDRMSTYERSELAPDGAAAQVGRRASARSFHNAVLDAMQAGIETIPHRDTSVVARVLDQADSEPPADFVLGEDLVYRQVESALAGRV